KLYIENPPRLVIDLFGISEKAPKPLSIGRGIINKIRFGRHRDKLRIVLDLNRALNPEDITLNGSGRNFSIAINQSAQIITAAGSLPTKPTKQNRKPEKHSRPEIKNSSSVTAGTSVHVLAKETGANTSSSVNWPVILVTLLAACVLIILPVVFARRNLSPEHLENETTIHLIDDELDLYYSILNLPRRASKAKIKKRYRMLAKKFHSDSPATQNLSEDGQRHATQQFRLVQEAYRKIMQEIADK
ncbi:MAG: AMIN domain-containing protein, partial [Candidatus Dadabacteria bacterium]